MRLGIKWGKILALFNHWAVSNENPSWVTTASTSTLHYSLSLPINKLGCAQRFSYQLSSCTFAEKRYVKEETILLGYIISAHLRLSLKLGKTRSVGTCMKKMCVMHLWVFGPLLSLPLSSTLFYSLSLFLHQGWLCIEFS